MYIVRNKYDYYEEDSLVLVFDDDMPTRNDGEEYKYWMCYNGVTIDKESKLYEKFKSLQWEDNPVEVTLIKSETDSYDGYIAKNETDINGIPSLMFSFNPPFINRVNDDPYHYWTCPCSTTINLTQNLYDEFCYLKWQDSPIKVNVVKLSDSKYS